MTKTEVERITIRRVPLLAWCALIAGMFAVVEQLDTRLTAARFVMTGALLLAGAYAATRAGPVLRLDWITVEIGDLRRKHRSETEDQG